MRFFKGDHEPVKERIRVLMQEAATAKKFERAASLRDHLHMVEKLEEKQLVSDPMSGDADFIGIALLSGRAHVIVLLQREGKVIGETHLSLARQTEKLFLHVRNRTRIARELRQILLREWCLLFYTSRTRQKSGAMLLPFASRIPLCISGGYPEHAPALRV